MSDPQRQQPLSGRQRSWRRQVRFAGLVLASGGVGLFLLVVLLAVAVDPAWRKYALWTVVLTALGAALEALGAAREAPEWLKYRAREPGWAGFLQRVDRRIIYAFVVVALSAPMLLQVRLTPAKMDPAEKAFAELEKLYQMRRQGHKTGIVMVAMDFGPSTQAENEPQAEATIRHLMYRRLPFVTFSSYVMAQGFMRSTPRKVKEQLEREFPGQQWNYGVDWVNLGYKPNFLASVQGLATDLPQYMENRDGEGNDFKSLPLMQGIKNAESFALLCQFTGLVGTFDTWVAYFQTETHRPDMVHGCTSISVPDAHVFLDSKQIVGLHEGIAGAASYNRMLHEQLGLSGVRVVKSKRPPQQVEPWQPPPGDEEPGQLLAAVAAKIGEWRRLLQREETPDFLASWQLHRQDVRDWSGLVKKLRAEGQAEAPSPSRRLWPLLSRPLRDRLVALPPDKSPDLALQTHLVGELNALLQRRDFYDPAAWPGAELGHEAQAMLASDRRAGDEKQRFPYRLNRLLLEAAFPKKIAPSAAPPPDVGSIEHMTSQSLAHLVILFFILLGNAAVFLNFLKRRRGPQGVSHGS